MIVFLKFLRNTANLSLGIRIPRRYKSEAAPGATSGGALFFYFFGNGVTIVCDLGQRVAQHGIREEKEEKN